MALPSLTGWAVYTQHVDHDRQARVIAARLSLTAGLPWMPPPDTRTRQEAQAGVPAATMPILTGPLPNAPAVVDVPASDTMVTLEEAQVARQALEDQLVADAEAMLAQPVPQDQPWSRIGLTILVIYLLLNGDDEDAPGIAGWLPRWHRRRRDAGLPPGYPTPAELAEALRGHLSSRATAEFNGLQASAIETAARRDPRIKLQWRARHDALGQPDSHVRPTHRVADGQIQPVGGLFKVGAALLPWPGFPGGPPEEVFGCRCVLLPTRS